MSQADCLHNAPMKHLKESLPQLVNVLIAAKKQMEDFGRLKVANIQLRTLKDKAKKDNQRIKVCWKNVCIAWLIHLVAQ